MDDNEALLKAFTEESREHLATIEADLLVIEEGGADIDEALVNKVFRAAHSIKGGSGFFGLEKVKQLAHKAETVLDMLRSRKISPNAEITNVLLAAFDQLREMIKQTDTSEQTDIADLLANLSALVSSYLPLGAKPAPPTPAKGESRTGNGNATLTPAVLEKARHWRQYIYGFDGNMVLDVDRKGGNILDFFSHLAATGEILACEVDAGSIGTLEGPLDRGLPLRLVFATVLEPEVISALFETIDPDRIRLLFDPHGAQSAAATASMPAAPPETDTEPLPLAKAASAPAPAPASAQTPAGEAPKPNIVPSRSAGKPAQASSSEETLRIDVGLLDTLMNLAGELVLSRNQVRVAVAQGNGALLVSAEQRINQVTSELQDVIMQTRLQPINNVFAKFPRLVRDLSRSLGKEILLDIQGKDVALDKTLIEGLSDPLTHMARNAVDHGIETPEERLAAGKKPMGTIRIEARHEAGQVVVEVADDGKGLDPKRLADAALRKGLITADKLLGMSDRDKQALIFLPGLSTAAQVSDVSGRGVGMDVVKTNLDRLGGQVEILSQVGKGSTFRIKLPLTLAVIPSLIISVQDERFAIPQTNIEELLRLRPEEFKTRIEVVGDREVLLLRDRILPLAHFADIVGALPTYVNPANARLEVDRRTRLADRRSPRHPMVEDSSARGADAPEAPPSFTRRTGERRRAATSTLEIAVVTTGALSYGLVVGNFHETEEVVVKPLGRRLKHLREYSGATILGDGTVALILDISGLAAKAGLASVSASARAKALAACNIAAMPCRWSRSPTPPRWDRWKARRTWWCWSPAPTDTR